MGINTSMEDNENEDSTIPNTPVYLVDEGTQELIEISLNCMVQLGDAQMDDSARENLLTIADEIAVRFGLHAYSVEEEITSDGETIYKPRGGVFNDLLEEDPDEDSDEDKTRH